MIEKARIISNDEIAKDVFRMELETNISKIAKPGQFIEIQVPSFFLRRPISINEIKDNSIVIIYKILGNGTKELSTFEVDTALDVFGPLGNGFPIQDKQHILLVGGGVGLPPLYECAKQYLQQGTKVDVIMGANDQASLFYVEEFKTLGCNVYIATMDGSAGTKGTVIDAIKEQNIQGDEVFACGPLPMLKALNQVYQKGYISLESRMACGMGACMGCVVKDVEGHSLRVCKDGPVFEMGKVAL
ncbi:dihydroorotate dehydrogenase electron transfer subunit [Floccifex sp.]|uniref:dihydroorotate dehydrogenase electron transfer subunit n=1 Tax=Floccifex sp. TaxID=2815810 RepID=UPI003F0CAFF6